MTEIAAINFAHAMPPLIFIVPVVQSKSPNEKNRTEFVNYEFDFVNFILSLFIVNLVFELHIWATVDMLSENQDESPFDSGENTSMKVYCYLSNFFCSFLLKTKEGHMVSQPTIDSIMDNTKILVGHCLETLSRDVKSCLAQNGLNWKDIEGLKEVFNNQVDNYKKAVDPVSTEYLPVKYVVDNIHYVVRL